MTREKTQLPELFFLILAGGAFAWFAMDILAMGAWALSNIINFDPSF